MPNKLSRPSKFFAGLGVYEVLWLGVPVAIWFAYQPLIRLGQDGAMYYELSVTMLYVLALALASLPSIWHHREMLIQMKSAWLVEAFVVISSLSLLWTMNPVRGILTVGVMGLLYLIFLGAMANQERLKKLLPKIVQIYLASAVVMSGLAILQFMAGVWLEPSVTLLCAGCVAEQFGFVRPNVFLIEPQFLGNALLPAVLILTHRLIGGRKVKDRQPEPQNPPLGPAARSAPEIFSDYRKQFRVLPRLASPTDEGSEAQPWQTWPALLLVAIVMVLTLSRGALLAMAVGLLVLFCLSWRKFDRWLKVGGVFVASLLLALGFQGLTATIHPTINETFLGAVDKSVNQLSMGLIDLQLEQLESKAEKIEPGIAVESQTDQPTEPNYDGYVEESTTARTQRSEIALASWQSDWPTMIFGVGVGSAGMAMHQQSPELIGSREIVQNEYVEVLLERGLIGLIGFLAVLAGAFWVSRQQKWLWAIIVAFMVQWLFFSGYPNALHIYLVLVVIGIFSMDRRSSRG